MRLIIFKNNETFCLKRYKIINDFWINESGPFDNEKVTKLARVLEVIFNRRMNNFGSPRYIDEWNSY